MFQTMSWKFSVTNPFSLYNESKMNFPLYVRLFDEIQAPLPKEILKGTQTLFT